MNTLPEAIAELKNAPSVDIKGKQYTQVSHRVEIFRKHFPPPEWGIITKIHSIQDDFVRVTAEVTYQGTAVASGLAEENRSQGPINRTSALENAETSAIGRAMANFGLHGGEYASAGEVANAISAQEQGGKDFLKTNLKAVSHDLVRDFLACTDMDTLIALWETKETKTFVKNAKSHYPDGLEAVIEAKDQMKDQLVTSEERMSLTSEERMSLMDGG